MAIIEITSIRFKSASAEAIAAGLIPSYDQKAMFIAAGFSLRLHRRDACATF